MSTYLSPSNESLPSLQTNAGKHTDWRDGLNNFFGTGVSSIDWSGRQFDENGRVKVTKADILIGRSQPELQAEYEKHRQQQIKNAAGQDYRRAFGTQLKVDHTTDLNEIEGQVADEVKRDSDTKPYLTALAQTDDGHTAIAELGARPTLQQVQTALSKLNSTNKGKEKKEKDTETRRQEGREDRLLLMQMLQNNRQSDREFQYRMAQDAYNNRRLDMQDARVERKDRQAALQQMMAGLAQMGASIAI